ncbi:MAG: porin, partial [Geminicoccaceae bacterium]|nr:porin [Geminicoccaceae bacterium]
TASNGTSEVDLSGTSLIGYSSVSDMAGGILYRDDGELSTISVGDAFSNLDGLSRDDRIRYDTPSFAGFKLSGSLVADERADVALRYSREFGGTEVAAAAAFSRKPDDFDRVNGSASILLANGISVTAAAGTEDVDARDDDGMFYYGKLGYQSQFFSVGNTALGIDYQYGEDIGADGDETSSFGVFAVQNIDDLATEFYLGYRYYDLDRDNTDLDAINAVLTGARVKF